MRTHHMVIGWLGTRDYSMIERSDVQVPMRRAGLSHVRRARLPSIFIIERLRHVRYLRYIACRAVQFATQ